MWILNVFRCAHEVLISSVCVITLSTKTLHWDAEARSSLESDNWVRLVGLQGYFGRKGRLGKLEVTCCLQSKEEISINFVLGQNRSGAFKMTTLENIFKSSFSTGWNEMSFRRAYQIQSILSNKFPIELFQYRWGRFNIELG